MNYAKTITGLADWDSHFKDLKEYVSIQRAQHLDCTVDELVYKHIKQELAKGPSFTKQHQQIIESKRHAAFQTFHSHADIYHLSGTQGRKVKKSIIAQYRQRKNILDTFVSAAKKYTKENQGAIANIYRLQGYHKKELYSSLMEKIFDHPNKIFSHKKFTNYLEEQLPRIHTYELPVSELYSDERIIQELEQQGIMSEHTNDDLVLTANKTEYYEKGAQKPYQTLISRIKKHGRINDKIARYIVGVYDKLPTDILAATIIVPQTKDIYTAADEIYEQQLRDTFFEIRDDPKGDLMIPPKDFKKLNNSDKEQHVKELRRAYATAHRNAIEKGELDRGHLLYGLWRDIIYTDHSIEVQILDEKIKQCMDYGVLSHNNVYSITRLLHEKEQIRKIGAEKTTEYIKKTLDNFATQ